MRLAVVGALLIACHGRGAVDSDGGIFTCTLPDDCDGDGYTKSADCDDTNPFVNPEAYDFPANGLDDDCDGTKDNPVVVCETSGTGPVDFARAADLCAQRSIAKTNVPFDPLQRAAWGQVKGYGPGQRIWTSQTKPVQVAIVNAFGMNAPRVGKTMVGMATGPWASPDPRNTAPLDDPTFKLNDACAEIPLDPEDCKALSNGAPAGGVSVQDWAELTLWLKVPSNARALAFDFAFFSTEFNQFWNASLNDAFFVLVTSKDIQGRNVAIDANNHPMTINSGLFQLCPKYPGPMGLSPEKLGALVPCVGTDGDPTQAVFGTLAMTGYDGAPVMGSNGNLYLYGGGSGWLTSRFTVTGGDQIVVRVIVHDTFDGYKDSAVLVDGFRWEPAPSQGVARPPR
jgi:hypothetical protein